MTGKNKLMENANKLRKRQTSYGKSKQARLLFSKVVISGISASDCKVLVVATNDGNVGGCHDTEGEAPGYEFDTENANSKERKQATAPKLIAYSTRVLRNRKYFLSSLHINTKFSLTACIVENSNSQKLLGVTIDRKLNFIEHLTNLCD